MFVFIALGFYSSFNLMKKLAIQSISVDYFNVYLAAAELKSRAAMTGGVDNLPIRNLQK